MKSSGEKIASLKEKLLPLFGKTLPEYREGKELLEKLITEVRSQERMITIYKSLALYGHYDHQEHDNYIYEKDLKKLLKEHKK